jgi:hypothetical protein
MISMGLAEEFCFAWSLNIHPSGKHLFVKVHLPPAYTCTIVLVQTSAGTKVLFFVPYCKPHLYMLLTLFCIRWLDELIIALWHDLQAYMEWKAQDKELLKTMNKSLAEVVSTPL